MPGADGTPRYTWIKYADDDKGSGMSDSAKNKRFLGMAHNKTTANESINPADYTWSPLYDNVIVGGRNLIRNSERLEKAEGISYLTISSGLKVGWYTISFDYKILKEELPIDSFLIYVGASIAQVPLKNPDKDRTQLTFEITPAREGTPVFLYLGRNASYSKPNHGVFIELQVEKGNIATDWSPAPEDTDQAIEDVDNRVTTTNASVTALDKEVKLKASQTDLNLVTGRVEHAETEIGLLPGKFNLTVQKNGVIGAINATPELFLIDFAKVKITNELEAKHIKSLAGLNVNDQFIVDANGKVTIGNNRVMIDDKGIQITRPDGAIAMNNGVMSNEYNVNSYDPHYMTAGKDEYSSFPAFNTLVGSPSWYTAVKGELDGRGVSGLALKYQDARDALGALAFQQYEFIHSARYLVFSYWKNGRAGKHSLHIVNGTSDKVEDRIYFEALEANRSGIIDCVIDLGKPTFRKRNVTFKIGWTHGWGGQSEIIMFRMVRVIQTDVL